MLMMKMEIEKEYLNTIKKTLKMQGLKIKDVQFLENGNLNLIICFDFNDEK